MHERTQRVAAADAVDPALVPQRRLYTGAMMPRSLGYVRFGPYPPSCCRRSRQRGNRGCYRHFDCASVYGNEAHIGNSFRELFASGMDREEIWGDIQALE